MNLRKGFKIEENGHLSLHGVDIVDVCKEYDTPLFIFDEEQLRTNYQRFRDAFTKHYSKVQIYYSIKTNYNLAICEIMNQEGAYAEVASGLDLYVAQQAGFPPERVSFDGPFKPERVLREAIDYGVSIINVESISELDYIDKIAGESRKIQNVGLRINTALSNKLIDSEQLYCNSLTRFGFSMEDTHSAVKHAMELKNIDIKGLMIHPYWGIHTFLPFVKQLQDEYKIDIEYLNFGGGLSKGLKKIGIVELGKDLIREKMGYRSNLDSIARPTSAIDPATGNVKQIEEVSRQVSELVNSTFGNTSHTLVFEPGRYLTEDTGILLLRVEVIKKSGGYKWAIVDGGTNLNSDWLTRREIYVANRASDSDRELVNIVGPLLFARDFVSIKNYLPSLREGDILAVLDSGAYTLSNSTQFLYPRPYAVLINEKGRVAVAREKEQYKDVLILDRSLPKS